MNTFPLITSIIENGITNNDERELLANSLFYYCSGKDPSPIIAFGGEYPLYIYADTDPDYEGMISALYQRLQSHGNTMLAAEELQLKRGRKQMHNISLTQWSALDDGTFCVVFFPYDAYEVFNALYSDDDTLSFFGLIKPKCICNYRYVFLDGTQRMAEPFFSRIEKRTEYILGYCFSDKYKIVAEYDYYGDYETGTTIPLFHRRYWYV